MAVGKLLRRQAESETTTSLDLYESQAAAAEFASFENEREVDGTWIAAAVVIAAAGQMRLKAAGEALELPF